LITGESGTGKEVLAAYIHRVADKADLPFVAVNCAALPDTLIESELFGHEKGAFTGATQRKMGKFEQVGEGTLVLDEIGDMPLALQPKILRVLQERRIERLGGAGDRPFNGQVVAITNQDLEAAVKDGRFREDLYYRINVVPLHLPPLRARPDDVPLLVQYFISQYASRYQKNLETPSPSILERMAAEEWRGNVRELENRIERAVLLSRGPQLDDELLRGNGPTIPTPDDAAVIQAGLSVKGMEKILICKTMHAVNHNRTRASELLGISIRTLRNKLKEYQTSHPDFQGEARP
jgi:DNA-binding NtrC family response regulator